MKSSFLVCIASILFLFPCCNVNNNNRAWIRINNLGYQPDAIKIAVLGSEGIEPVTKFSLVNAYTDSVVYTSNEIKEKGMFGPFKSSFRLDFSKFKTSGMYYLKVGSTKSPVFKIDDNVYEGTADFLLKYMRQQRCGYNPFLTDSCHLDDGFIVYHPTKSGERIDVTGGWHDASDYLQYTTTSANAIYQLLFAYRENSMVFGDEFQENGLPGSNGVPDVIDEAKHGMDWLQKMNPSPDEYYNQIADDRDHAGYRLPNEDTVVYSEKYKGRPLYLASSKPQGLGVFKNRSTGVASTAGKFASSFALGADVLSVFYPKYAKDLKERSIRAYTYGKTHPGVSQTAPCKAPYFYEEENWKDDMELAAASLFKFTKKLDYKIDGLNYAISEPVSPWIGRDSIRHYQYYPFLNVGHYEMASISSKDNKELLSDFYRKGLEMIYERAKDSPFLVGTPFVWCSNNYVTAAVTQCLLYKKLTGDESFDEMEASLRDWLFGCNPWGTTMIVGLPNTVDSPEDPHSSFKVLKNYQTYGGLVDGPVYGSIYNSLIGLELYNKDEYADFQSEMMVYHDDAGDYSTNEPTMDGTASLVYYLSSLEKHGMKGRKRSRNVLDNSGAIVRGRTSRKKLTLIFSGHEYSDGVETILKTLKKHRIKASFFLTGEFYKNKANKDFIEKAMAEGHYMGAHSDKHLLYNDWSDEKKILVKHDQFTVDLINNYIAMEKFGILKKDATYFLPPYEWNNNIITQWALQQDIQIINYTRGTLMHADYTIPNTKQYRSSEEIFNSVKDFEKREGLNGAILLSHLGSHPARTDKFYNSLDNLIVLLKDRGYVFESLSSLLGSK
ncbi:Peptidoglycan/xylan/chitin deacetylase, PgdA/CDA1 family [Zhouia amylolytica]|uniref:Peptidoglycan/xylan/chitin deacetylase, PgdA/CDA1 family n=1 Tax=Zhouia amylolytica TaxID=376730 RepID=A0A1I6QY00_9FLAO|nr:glycoside hydrolase family 9 protein [Zhouia amylolytica]SFS57381.1 Peptidoglycan/xylan/chitin deacetylase, PgdA/CDA1 family [Zhouia amylolytica]